MRHLFAVDDVEARLRVEALHEHERAPGAGCSGHRRDTNGAEWYSGAGVRYTLPGANPITPVEQGPTGFSVP